MKKEITENELDKRMLKDFEMEIKCLTQRLALTYLTGVNFKHSKEYTDFGNSLLSLSNQQIREPYIDKFLWEHKYILGKILGYKNIIKVTMNWQASDNNSPDESKPDFILVKEDDTLDILEIKTGALKHRSITKGKKIKKEQVIRPRFIDYVNELISQLEEYKRYFSRQKHIDDFKNKYSLRVDKQNMMLWGLVGNQNNFDTTDVARSLEPYKPHIKIISYFEIANMTFNYRNTGPGANGD